MAGRGTHHPRRLGVVRSPPTTQRHSLAHPPLCTHRFSYPLRMLTMRGVGGGMLAVLLLAATGCSSPSKTATPAAAPTTAKTGIIVINPQVDGAGSFSDGLAAVRIGDDKTGKWGYIAR